MVLVVSVAVQASDVAYSPAVGVGRISETDVPISGAQANMFIGFGVKEEALRSAAIAYGYIEATPEQKANFIAVFGAKKIEDFIALMKKKANNPVVSTVFLVTKSKEKPKP